MNQEDHAAMDGGVLTCTLTVHGKNILPVLELHRFMIYDL